MGSGGKADDGGTGQKKSPHGYLPLIEAAGV
jgi:hypothetical protein